MFIRVKTTPNSPRKSVQIVESVRDGTKVRQRIVRHVGVAFNEKELGRLLELAEYIKSEIQEEHTPTLFGADKMASMVLEAKRSESGDDEKLNVNLAELKEEQRGIVGIHEVYSKIYNELGFNKLISSRHGESPSEILRHIVMARIANPKSKRACVNDLETDFGVKIDLQKVYRMMDKLDDAVCQKIQDNAYQAANELFGKKIDLVFFDATTLYFESFTEDELKQNGFSKDHKYGQPQVLLALMVTDQGIPIGYEAFPGSTYEGHTLIPMLESFRAKYNLDKIVFVADSGLLSAKNLDAMDKAGFKYIVGARLRKLTKDLQEKVTNRSHYVQHESGVELANFEYGNNRKLFVSYSEKRAKKDASDREKSINKLKAKLEKSKKPKQLIAKGKSSKFLKIIGDSEVAIDEATLQNDSQWDGLHGIVTNDRDMSHEDVMRQYRGLWQVEESFRITKHDLKVRPIYHWTPERIRAHLAISFISYTCVRHLEYRIGLQYKKLSPEAIRSALTRVQASILIGKDKVRYVVPSQASQDARKIYQAMGLKYSTKPYRIDI